MAKIIAAFLLFSAVVRCDAAYSWGLLKPDNGGFSVELPGEPQHSTGSGTNPDSFSEMWLVKTADGLTLTMIGLTDYYDPNPMDLKEEFSRDEKNFLAGVKGTPTSQKRTTFPGAHGKKLPSSIFTFETESGWTGRSRIIADKDTTYQTVVMWKRMLEGAAVQRRFEGSFKLLPRIKPPNPTPKPAPQPSNEPASPSATPPITNTTPPSPPAPEEKK